MIGSIMYKNSKWTDCDRLHRPVDIFPVETLTVVSLFLRVCDVCAKDVLRSESYSLSFMSQAHITVPGV